MRAIVGCLVISLVGAVLSAVVLGPPYFSRAAEAFVVLSILSGGICGVSLLAKDRRLASPTLPQSMHDALNDAVGRNDLSAVEALLQRGADVCAPLGKFYPDEQPEVRDLLMKYGEEDRSRELIKAFVRVEVPTPDATLHARARQLGSAFIAHAERLKDQGDLEKAWSICKWKLDSWDWPAVWSKDITLPMLACLRVMAETMEASGKLEEALSRYLFVLAGWRRRHAPENSGTPGADEATPALLTVAALQAAMKGAPEERDEQMTLLQHLHRILPKMGMQEEHERVDLVLEQLRAERKREKS